MPNPDAAAQPAPDLATAFGTAALAILAGRVGAPAAAEFARAVIEPTYPGTPARTKQDAAWAALTRRLVAATEELGDVAAAAVGVLAAVGIYAGLYASIVL